MDKITDTVPSADAVELRSQAEAALRKGEPEKVPSLSEDEVRRLLHELQVHQIELELQNAELRQTKDEVEAMLEKYTDLYDFAPVGYTTLDHDGTIRSVNLTGARLLGIERSLLVGRRCGMFVSADTRSTFNQFLAEAFTSQRETTCEVTLERERHSPLQVQIRAHVTANGNECRAAIIDISERKMADKLRRESEHRFKVLAAATFEGVAISEAGRITDVNEQLAHMLGYDPAELIGIEVAVLLPPEDRDRVLSNIRQGIESHLEHTMIRKDGSSILVEARGRNIKYRDLTVRITAVRDITEHKRLDQQLQGAKDELELRVQERSADLVKAIAQLTQGIESRTELEGTLRDSQFRLRNLAAHLHSIREEERKAVAREIHDELGQLLAAIQMGVIFLAGEHPDHQNPNPRITDMEVLIADAIKTVQRISSDLRPAMLDVLGLADALEWLGSEFQKRTGITCKIIILLLENEVLPEVATVLFRIIQESLTNVQRHSLATKVEVLLVERRQKYRLTIRDNGKGITAEEISSPLSIGLIGIRERVFILGGRVKIFGSSGQGTALFVSVPVKPKEKWYANIQENYHR